VSRYLIRRLVSTVPVILGVIFIIMLTVSLIPGDPVALMLGQNAAPEQVAALRDYLGLDRPLLVRYVEYLGQIVRGDLGRSIQGNRPVLDEIREVWPNTIRLTAAAVVLAVLAGIGIGALSAMKPYSLLDNVVRVVALLGLSMPIFWIGLVLSYIFGYYLGLLPVGGTGGIKHLVLPAVTLALPSIALIARMTRSSLLEVLGEDYVRTARAKGLRGRTVLWRHALGNALIPVISVIGLQIGQLLGGAVLTETVFAWPGLGRLMVRAIFARDYVLLQGAVLVLAITFVLVNLLVDLSYAYLDPRISYS
jgi:peptide/nickel transport system permease protein/oligopeptide transport system permease protein